jgi:CHAT domain-containing protein/Tfp pilus assembly protein PilF
VRRLTLVVVCLLAACSRERRSLEDLQASGYRELRTGDLQAARAHADEGRRLAGERGDAGWERRFRILSAEVLAGQGRSAEALAFLEAEPRSTEPPHTADVRALLTRAYVLCVSSSDEDRFRRAGADLEEAARLAGRLESAALAAEVTLRRGTCALYRGEAGAAEEYFREALDEAHRQEQPYLEALAAASLGFLRVRKGQYDDGADWLNRTLDLAASAEAHLVLARTLLNLGWCYVELGDYDRALTLLSRAAAQAESRGQTGDRQTALQNMGNAHYRLGDLASAADHYRRALALARDIDDPQAVAQLLSNLGVIALEQERYDEAESAIREALAIKAKIEDRAGTQNSLLAEGQIWAGRGEHAKAEARYREVIGSPDTEQVALWETHASLARLYVKTRQATKAESEFRKGFVLMEQFRGKLRQMEHKISFFSSLRQFYDSYVDFLVEGGRAEEALTVADESRALLLRETLATGGRPVPAVSPAPAQETARALDAVILSYWMAPRRSFLWAVTPGKVALHLLPDEAVIEKHVEAHQELIARSRDPLAEAAPDAEWLYRNLVEPARASIPRESRVVFVADGPLHRINPETLVVPTPQPHYFLEDVTLTAAPSLVLLAQAPRRVPRPTAGILLIGDAISASGEFPALPHAAKEVAAIAERFLPAERSVYSGALANPSVYKTADPRRFTYIHFAAHAQANREVPFESAVILSPRNDSFKLYARDVVGIPLEADLVTLSACRSAGSRTYAGEGLVGLAWAFLSAGAANVVAGLWNVEDSSTADLMGELYRGLREGRDPAESLRAAKLGFLRSETAHRKPYYWAPFMTYAARRGGTSASVRRAQR